MRIPSSLALLAGIALVISVAAGCQHAEAPTKPGIALEVKPLKDGGSYVLDLRLVSHLDKPVEVWEWRLPWGNWNSMRLSAAVYENGVGTEVLDHPGPIDDPGEGNVTIKPGEELTGRVGLSHHFPDLDRIIKNHDVLVNWSYQLTSVDGELLVQQHGSIVLSKE